MCSNQDSDDCSTIVLELIEFVLHIDVDSIIYL